MCPPMSSCPMPTCAELAVDRGPFPAVRGTVMGGWDIRATKATWPGWACLASPLPPAGSDHAQGSDSGLGLEAASLGSVPQLCPRQACWAQTWSDGGMWTLGRTQACWLQAVRLGFRGKNMVFFAHCWNSGEVLGIQTPPSMEGSKRLISVELFFLLEWSLVKLSCSGDSCLCLHAS